MSDEQAMQFNEPSWISLEPRNHFVYNALLSYLDKASANPATVQQLTDSTITALSSMSTENASADQYTAESRILFAVLFTIVKQLDAAAVQQDQLIKFVLSLRHVPLPETVTQDINLRGMDSNMNAELGKLINVLADFEADAPMHPPLEARPCHRYTQRKHQPWRQRRLTGGEWASINAFIARLHIAAPDLTRLDIRGLFAMIEALEQSLTSNQLEDVLPAAACWIVYAGKTLQTNDIRYANIGDDGSRRFPGSKGELWTGRHAFNQARWEFWMQRFAEIAARSDVSTTVRQAAWNALEAESQ